MDTLNWSLNDRRFDGPITAQKIVTDVLFNRGFERYAVHWEETGGIVRDRVIWAKGQGDIENMLKRAQWASTVKRKTVSIQKLPFGLYYGQRHAVKNNYGQVIEDAYRTTGDAILSEEMTGQGKLWDVLAESVAAAFPEDNLFPPVQVGMFE